MVNYRSNPWSIAKEAAASRARAPLFKKSASSKMSHKHRVGPKRTPSAVLNRLRNQSASARKHPQDAPSILSNQPALPAPLPQVANLLNDSAHIPSDDTLVDDALPDGAFPYRSDDYGVAKAGLVMPSLSSPSHRAPTSVNDTPFDNNRWLSSSSVKEGTPAIAAPAYPPPIMHFDKQNLRSLLFPTQRSKSACLPVAPKKEPLEGVFRFDYAKTLPTRGMSF